MSNLFRMQTTNQADLDQWPFTIHLLAHIYNGNLWVPVMAFDAEYIWKRPLSLDVLYPGKMLDLCGNEPPVPTSRSVCTKHDFPNELICMRCNTICRALQNPQFQAAFAVLQQLWNKNYQVCWQVEPHNVRSMQIRNTHAFAGDMACVNLNPVE